MFEKLLEMFSEDWRFERREKNGAYKTVQDSTVPKTVRNLFWSFERMETNGAYKIVWKTVRNVFQTLKLWANGNIRGIQNVPKTFRNLFLRLKMGHSNCSKFDCQKLFEIKLPMYEKDMYVYKKNIFKMTYLFNQ